MPSTTEDTLLAAAPGQQSMPTVPQQAPVTTVRSEPSAPQSALDTFNNRAEALVSLFISAVGW
jgi:hypothetical protein